MESEILAAAAGAAAALLLVVVVLSAGRRRRSRADLEAMLAAAHRESDDLRQRLEELTARRDQPRDPLVSGAPGEPASPVEPFRETSAEPAQADFVITRAGEPEDIVEPVRVPDRLVLSATLGGPLVKVVAFSHGVRRALSPESRNRIRFEIKREVRASRKRRRRLVKDYLRETRAQERASEGLA